MMKEIKGWVIVDENGRYVDFTFSLLRRDAIIHIESEYSISWKKRIYPIWGYRCIQVTLKESDSFAGIGKPADL